MDDQAFRGDCARCSGLCCMALAFDRSDAFAVEKPAGTSCAHLGADRRCTIHADRHERGFGGCVAYDCLGAGQLTTALFGRPWTDSLADRRVHMQVFARLRALQGLRLLAHRHGLTVPERFVPHAAWRWSTVLLLDLEQLRRAVATALLSVDPPRKAASE